MIRSLVAFTSRNVSRDTHIRMFSSLSSLITSPTVTVTVTLTVAQQQRDYMDSSSLKASSNNYLAIPVVVQNQSSRVHPRASTHAHAYHTTSLNKSSTDSTPNPTYNETIMSMTGEECYNRSIEYFEKHTKQQKEIEDKNANEQYEAMMKMSPHGNNSSSNVDDDDDDKNGNVNVNITKTKNQTETQKNRQANIAVVRTITKQTREQMGKSTKVRANNSQEATATAKAAVEEDLQKKANEYMQYAAFIHGHPKALVQLANEALELAKQKQEKIKNPYTFITNSSMASIIDVDNLIQSNQSFVDIAKVLYQEAIDRGNNNAAMYNLANLLWTESEEEEVVIENDNYSENENDFQIMHQQEHMKELKKIESIQLFHKAAMELNDTDALYFLGVQYFTLLGMSEKDENSIYFKSSSEGYVLQNTLDQNDMKTMHELRQLGYEMIQKASNSYHGGASYYLSLVHRNGDVDLDIKPSISKFRHFLNLACDGDDSDDGNSVIDADALYLRAHCIYHCEDGYGDTTTTTTSSSSSSGSNHHFKDALRDFLKAGEAGNPNGCISAGAMLHHGHGNIIPQDQRRAFELYQEAGEMGSTDGWRNVVACYALGQGVPKCEQTAKYITETMLNDDP